MNNKMLGLLVASALVAPLAAGAAPLKSVSGSSGGFTWEATSRIIGQTPTGSAPSPAAVGGGDPLYFPDYAKHSGVVALIMEYPDGSAFICSGSLTPDRRHIVTAAHCVSNGFGTAGPARTTAYFYGGPDPDQKVSPNRLFPGGPFVPEAGVTVRTVGQTFVNPGYTVEVIDHNDIAVLRLQNIAPDFAQSYGFYTGDDLGGETFNVAGYGGRQRAAQVTPGGVPGQAARGPAVRHTPRDRQRRHAASR